MFNRVREETEAILVIVESQAKQRVGASAMDEF